MRQLTIGTENKTQDTSTEPQRTSKQILEDQWLKLTKDVWFVISTFLEKRDIRSLMRVNSFFSADVVDPRDAKLRRTARAFNFNLSPDKIRYKYLDLVPGSFNDDKLEDFYQMYIKTICDQHNLDYGPRLKHVGEDAFSKFLKGAVEQCKNALENNDEYEKPYLNAFPVLMLLEYMYAFLKYKVEPETDVVSFDWLLVNLLQFELPKLSRTKLKFLKTYRHHKVKLTENTRLLFRNWRLFANLDFMVVLLKSHLKNNISSNTQVHGCITLWRNGLWKTHGVTAFENLDSRGWATLEKYPYFLTHESHRNIILNNLTLNDFNKTRRKAIAAGTRLSGDLNEEFSGFKLLHFDFFLKPEIFSSKWNIIEFVNLTELQRKRLLTLEGQYANWSLVEFKQYANRIYGKSFREANSEEARNAIRKLSFINLNEVPEINSVELLKLVYTAWCTFGLPLPPHPFISDYKMQIKIDYGRPGGPIYIYDEEFRFGSSHLHQQMVKHCLREGRFSIQTWNTLMRNPVVKSLFIRNIPKISNWLLSYIFEPNKIEDQTRLKLDELSEVLCYLPSAAFAEISSCAELTEYEAPLWIIATCIEDITLHDDELQRFFALPSGEFKKFVTHPIFKATAEDTNKDMVALWNFCCTNLEHLEQHYTAKPEFFKQRLRQLSKSTELYVNELDNKNNNVELIKLSWFDVLTQAFRKAVRYGKYIDKVTGWLVSAFDQNSRDKRLFDCIFKGSVLEFLAFIKPLAKHFWGQIECYEKFQKRKDDYREIHRKSTHAYLCKWFFTRRDLQTMSETKFNGVSCLAWISSPTHYAMLKLFLSKVTTVLATNKRGSNNCGIEIYKNHSTYRIWVDPAIQNYMIKKEDVDFLIRLTKSGLIKKPTWIVKLLERVPLHQLKQLSENSLKKLAELESIEMLDDIIENMHSLDKNFDAKQLNDRVGQAIIETKRKFKKNIKRKINTSNDKSGEKALKITPRRTRSGEVAVRFFNSRSGNIVKQGTDVLPVETPSTETTATSSTVNVGPNNLLSLTECAHELGLPSETFSTAVSNEKSVDDEYEVPGIYDVYKVSEKAPQGEKREHENNASDFDAEMPHEEAPKFKLSKSS